MTLGNKLRTKSCLSIQYILLSYTGKAPDAFFYIGTSGNPKDAETEGILVQYPAGQDDPLGKKIDFFFDRVYLFILGAYAGDDIELSLPKEITASEVIWVSVWCRQYSINFGHAFLNEGDAEAEPESEPESPGGASTSRVFSVFMLLMFFLHLLYY